MGLPRGVVSLVMQVEIIIDNEVSLQLLPCVASRFGRMARQHRLQSMWRQKRRWTRLIEAYKASTREGRLRMTDCE